MSFLDLLRQTRESTLKAFDNQDVPFDKLVEVLQSPEVLHKTHWYKSCSLSRRAKPLHSAWPISLFRTWCSTNQLCGLIWRFLWSERPNQLRCVMYYLLDVLKPSTTDKFGNELLEFLGTVAKNLDTALVSDRAEFETIELEVRFPILHGLPSSNAHSVLN